MSGVWRKTGDKFYAGKLGETPWNNDLHHKHTLENENHYYHLLATKSMKFNRDRNPFNLTLDEVVSDSTVAKQYAVRQTNGLRPICSHRTEPNTDRRLDQTVSMMRETNNMLSTAIPELRAQVEQTNNRIQRLERRRTASAGGLRSEGGTPHLGAANLMSGGRATYQGGQQRGRSNNRGVSQARRAQSALSVRSGASSAMMEAQNVLGKATGLLQARPQTAKTTKTVLSHRNRHGWSTALRDGDIIKHAGKNAPSRKGGAAAYSMESDHDTGELRRRPVKARPATALGLRQPSCRRMPGYKAPAEDYGPNPPGEGTEDPSFYVRPEDLDIRNPGHD